MNQPERVVAYTMMQDSRFLVPLHCDKQHAVSIPPLRRRTHLHPSLQSVMEWVANCYEAVNTMYKPECSPSAPQEKPTIPCTGQQSYKHRNSTYRKKQTKPNPCTFFPSARTCEKATHACTTYNHTRLVVVGVLLVAANTSDFHYFDASYTITRLTRILHSSRTVHAQLWEAPKVTKHG